MRNKILIILGIFFAIAVSNISISVYLISNDGTIETNLKNPKSSGYWTMNFIHIDDNWSATATTYDWCSGDGSWSNPYIIENVTINASGSPTGSGILINNSKNDYFIIRNCSVYNGGSGTEDAGIKLENTNNGILTNNNCSYNDYNGIILFNNCENNTISENTANDNNNFGINLNTNCNDNTISGNKANNNGVHGIRLWNSCSDNTVLGNNANDNNQIGIRLRYSSNNNIITENNASNNNWEGIFLGENCDYNIISDNNVSFNNREGGIYLYMNCDWNTIARNTVNNNDGDGIWLRNYCENNIISGNTANNNTERGVTMSSYCVNNIISGNTANNNNYYGILLSNYCNNNTVSNNIANENNPGGMYLWNYCDENTVSGNIINYNDEYGINLYRSSSNTISGNFIHYNDLYGILLDIDSGDNLFYLNGFIENENHAKDEGSNQWDNGIFGNYWDNYSGYDFLPIDGIGDSPHAFPDNTSDTKPLMYLWWDTPPQIPLWYPMPNLKISHLSSVVAYNKTSFTIDFSITNNGIWKAQGVIIILRCEELGLTLFDNTISPLTLDVDETKYIAINCPPIGQIGTFTLNLTVDPYNTIAETYSSKDGSIRIDAENDNAQTAILTILSENIEEYPKDTEEPPLDITPIAISSIAGVIGVAAVILVLMRTRKRTS